MKLPLMFTAGPIMLLFFVGILMITSKYRKGNEDVVSEAALVILLKHEALRKTIDVYEYRLDECEASK